MKTDYAGLEYPARISLEALAAEVSKRAGVNRIIVAIAGAPGSGKTTTTSELRDELQNRYKMSAQIVPMDGFHYDNAVLEDRGLAARKGSPETFDVAGLESILIRLTEENRSDVAVPVFDRLNDLARASARIIYRDTRIIFVEGNYLLLRDEPWSRLRPYFDLSVMIECDETTLRERLMKRWLDLGYGDLETTCKVETNDLPNARLVLTQSLKADVACCWQDS